MLLADLLSIALRVGELAFAAIVAGLTGQYLHAVHKAPMSSSKGRFIYTEVVAAVSILLSIVWLLPFAGGFIHWPVDLVISAAWFAAFGLLVNWLHGSCGAVFDWSSIAVNGSNACPEWKADLAFCFLSAIFWLVSTLLGIFWLHRRRRSSATTGQSHHRRPWYRSHV